MFKVLCVSVVGFYSSAALALSGGDVNLGKSKASTCFACHGSNGNSTNPMYPVLAGKDADYIFTQLKAFKSGTRTAGNAAIMKPFALALSEQDMKNLAAFFSTQKPAETGRRKRN